MKQFDILKKIGVIINELQEQYQFIEETKDDINDLELELFLANTQFLAEHIEILRKLNYQQYAAQRAEHAMGAGERYFEPVVQPPSQLDNDAHFPEPDIYVIESEETTPDIYTEEEYEEDAKADIKEPIALDLFAELENKPDVKDQADTPFEDEQFTSIDEINETLLEEETPNIAVWKFEKPDNKALHIEETTIKFDDEIDHESTAQDTLLVPDHTEVTESIAAIESTEPAEEQTATITINERISAQMANQTRLSDNLELQPIKDLKSTISLNDKMLFVRDLFNGYSLSYSEAIEILNRFTKFDDADNFLKQNYVVKNNWEGKLSSYEKFYGLIRRRFPQ